jgi:GT2 family glycosyltransferase
MMTSGFDSKEDEMNPIPKVSIIVISYNRREQIRGTLSNLLNENYPNYEVVVVDNGSQDGSAEMISREFPSVRLIKMPRNVGCPNARNIGFVNAEGAIIVLIDDDAVFEKNWMTKVVEKFSKEPKVAVLAAKILNYYTKEVCNWHYHKDAAQFADTEFEVYQFVGCAAAIRKSVLDEVGLFPEEIFMNGEESDLSIRIMDAGYEIRYYPGLVAYHKLPAGASNRPSKDKAGRRAKNAINFYWKFYPVPVALIVSTLIIPPTLIQAFKIHCLKLYFRSTTEGLWNIPHMFANRKHIKREVLWKATPPRLRLLMRLLGMRPNIR